MAAEEHRRRKEDTEPQNGKQVAIDNLIKSVDGLEERLHFIELGNCPMGIQHEKRITLMDTKIDSLQKALWIGIGILAALQFFAPIITSIILRKL